MYYLSRAFVEFGPFPAAELLSFSQRGLLRETDYLRAEMSDTWVHLSEWLASTAVSPAPAAAEAPVPAKPKAAKKAAKAKPVAEEPAPAKKSTAKKPKKAA